MSLPPRTDYDWAAVIRAHKPKIVIDAGANVGGFVSTWLEMGAEHVFAYEPVPDCFAKLAAKFARDSRVSVFNVGLSDALGRLERVSVHHAWSLLEEGQKVAGPYQPGRAVEYLSAAPFDVELVTIDNDCEIGNIAPNFIKIDTDGYDARVLRGARKTIATYRPLIMLELSYLPSLYGDCAECMVRSLYSIGYRIQHANSGEIFASVRDVMAAFPWNTSYDVLCLPETAH